VLALDGGLGVREDGADVVALVASNVQEERVGCLNKFLKFVHVLFRDGIGVQKVHFHSDYPQNPKTPQLIIKKLMKQT